MILSSPVIMPISMWLPLMLCDMTGNWTKPFRRTATARLISRPLPAFSPLIAVSTRPPNHKHRIGFVAPPCPGCSKLALNRSIPRVYFVSSRPSSSTRRRFVTICIAKCSCSSANRRVWIRYSMIYPAPPLRVAVVY